MNRRAFLLSLPAAMSLAHASSAPELQSIALVDIHGKTTSIAAFSGKVLLIVNVASECGYTTQYEGLEAVYKRFRDRGLVVLGFPCDDFGGQEPGDEKQILKFCTSRYNVSFPMFSKVKIRESEVHPLFKALTGPASPIPGPVRWNFSKFLVGRDGLLAARFGPETEPGSEEMVSSIQKALESNQGARQ